MASVTVTIELDDDQAERFARQAARFKQTIADYMLSWAKSGLCSDEEYDR